MDYNRHTSSNSIRPGQRFLIGSPLLHRGIKLNFEFQFKANKCTFFIIIIVFVSKEQDLLPDYWELMPEERYIFN